MTLRVPFIPPAICPTGSELNDIKNATPVLGDGQWQQMAAATNWALGRGGQVLVCGPVRPDQLSAATTTMLWTQWPRSHHTTRLWLLGVRGITITSERTESFVRGIIQTQSVGCAVQQYPLTVPAEDNAPTQIIEIVEDFTVATAGTIALATTPSIVNSFQIDSVICVEMPRNTLDSSAGSVGVVADSCRSHAAIYAPLDTAHAKNSVEGVSDQVVKASTTARRQKMFDCYRHTGYTITTTVYTDLFYLPPAVQTRLLTEGDTVDSVTCVVRAVVSTGTGNVLFTAASGDTLTLTVNTTATMSYTGTIDVETDDWSRSDLIRGATRDTLTIQARKNTSGSITVYGISIGES